jgi:hypothetical protein
MTSPEIRKCPDGHYRHVVYGLGPYIADYPEQVLLACVVNNWCPRYAGFLLSDSTSQTFRCTAMFYDLDGTAFRWTEEWTDCMICSFNPAILWDDYGIVADIIVCNNLLLIY